MRRTRARRAVMIGTAALLLVAPCATLAQADPAAPAPALPADLVAAIQRDLKISPEQYLDRAETGQELAAFADTLRGKFPTAFAGAWLDAAGAPLVGLADGPDKAAARTAVEAAGYQVKDQSRSENALNDLLGQLNTWIQQLPAPLSGHINGTKVDTVNNDIVLGVHDIAGGQGLQLPDFLNFVRIAQGPASSPSDLPGLGSLGSLGSSDPTKPTDPTGPTDPASTTVTLDPITGATVGKATTLTATVNPAGAGGEIDFADGDDILGTAQVGANGKATHQWTPTTAGQRTITAIFSGRDGVPGSTTTAQVTVAPAGSNPATSTITLDPIKGATVDKAITLKAKVNTSVADGSVDFKDGDIALGPRWVEDDGTATIEWTPTTAGKRTITATFSGFENVPLATTTQQVTVAGPPKPKPPAPNAIMGGDVYASENAEGEVIGWCSLGFNGTDASGHAVNVSAGHCDANPDAAGTPDASIAHEMSDGVPGARFGTFAKSSMKGLDYAVIRAENEFARRFENNYVRVRGKAPVAITGTADPVVGAPVCLSGTTSGYRCGKIYEATTNGTGPNGADFRAFSSVICSLPGDSGGALITGTKALGILSRGGATTQADCDRWAADPEIPDFYRPKALATPITEILNANPGLKIRTN
ncbi:Ig-like domain repeat protein [Rhodococcus maanshanensis]|uniref:Ig-like domain (Group 3) n=1 Tax=Rhodococcus maanshanensis TaxID=183556 RepID=A0A1H7J770_9NOCA|nr:Ig-like domain repeat protein [Rhodococcus maanshanensis]SEK70581.1 Ig-like domain (group 3) [Rhodococcus maanshanensis]